MKRKLLFTCMLVLGMLSVPVKVIGQKVLPEKYGNYSYTVEGTAGTVKWRVYPESQSSSYARIYFSSNASSPVVKNSWTITNNPSSVTITTLFQNVKYADLSYYQEGEYPRIGKIDANTFSQFKNLISVILPWRRDFQIGDYAFYGCGSLTSVYAYTNANDALSAEGLMYVSSIGEGAFEGTSIRCSKIGTDAYEQGIIGSRAFYGCSDITELTIDNVNNIGNLAFGDCFRLSTLTFGDYVYDISSNAFEGCANLQAIHIGKNVSKYTCWNTIFPASLGALETITVSADNANYLSTATNCLVDKKDFTLYLGTNSSVIPNTVKIIGVDAFNGCSGLSTINIPASVTEIRGNAFLNCTRLASVWCESETPASIQTTSFKNIYSDAVLYVPTIEAVTAYKNSAWNNYFSDIRFAKKEANGMSWGLIPYGTGTGKYTLGISGIEELGNFSAEGGAPWSQYIDKIVEVDVSYGVKRIGHSAFKGFGAAGTEVTFNLPSSLVSIADYAFFSCPTLKNITIPASVETIGAACFRSCPVLESFTFEEGSKLTSIAQNAFGECPKLKNITIPASVKTIGRECFAWCSALESVTFEGGSKLTTIGGYAFQGCEALKNITIPASVETIGEFCFAYCSALESVTFKKGSKLTTIGEFCFAYCSALESVTFEGGSKLTAIGGYAFKGCEALKSITIPASVGTIGESCFASCSALESVTYEDGSILKSIGNNAFDFCGSLKNIIIPASVSTIGENCFNVCSALESVTFEESCKLSSIANFAFNGCSALQSITIPASVETIGQYCFAGCTKLSSVTIGESVTGIGVCAFSDIPDGAVITCLSYEQKIVDVQESSFNPNSVLRVYFTPNYSDLSSYFSSVEGIPVTITDGSVENYEDIYEEDILLSCMEYKRTLLADSRWNALYVPFEIPVADIADKYDVAYINDVRLYDSNNDGEIDENGMEVEVVYVKSGTLHANTPYLIRVKKTLSAEAKEEACAMNLALSTKLCLAEEKVYDCSSLYKTFTFGGIYKKKTAAEDLPGAYAISSDGIWHPMSAGSSLKPFRIYMKIENRDGTPFQPDAAEAGIRIRVAGEDNATGIAETEGDNGKAEIYDIAGRRVQNPAKGIYVVNGKKRVIK
ncbi:MAG: leucine-rich repeat domain-containing protein [Bacteroidaceae bacterium]|nr:leucine-rich repeat domain-containing protein [Bacteroidaceae bacterium]